MFISQNGMVQRTSVRGINRYGRASQGVRVMNIRDDDQVSAVALVVESEAATAAAVAEDPSTGEIVGVEPSAQEELEFPADGEEPATADEPTADDDE